MSTSNTHHHESDDSTAEASSLEAQTQQWLAYARRQHDLHGLEIGAFQEERARRALHFTEAVGLSELAVPFELVGALRVLREHGATFGAALRTVTASNDIAVSLSGMLLGYAPTSTAVWLRPLLEDVTLRLARVTDQDDLYAQVYASGLSGALTTSNTNAELPLSSSEDGAPAVANGLIGANRICLWRDACGTAQMNIPHVVRHSPTGIEWGYGGSGPSDLAYSILCYILEDEDEARRLHLSFKEEVVAQIPREGCDLPIAGIRQWIERRY